MKLKSLTRSTGWNRKVESANRISWNCWQTSLSLSGHPVLGRRKGGQQLVMLQGGVCAVASISPLDNESSLLLCTKWVEGESATSRKSEVVLGKVAIREDSVRWGKGWVQVILDKFKKEEIRFWFSQVGQRFAARFTVPLCHPVPLQQSCPL